MNSNLSEQHTNNFYEWEQRGRGWLFWDSPVELEPPYVPFFYSTRQLKKIEDDGRKPTFWSNVSELFLGGSRKSITTSNLPDKPFSVSPQVFNDRSTKYEIVISIPREAKVNLEEQFAQILILLSSTRFPISFEIVATSESITPQIVCWEYDYQYVRQILRAHLTQVQFQERVSILENRLPVIEINIAMADFGLSEEFMRPLKTFNRFEPDPLAGIIGVLENLERDELALLQILFKGTHNAWARSIMESVTDSKGNSFFLDAPEMVQLAREKIRSPLFAASIRVLAKSYSESKAWTLLKDLAGALSITSNAQSNELIPLLNDDYGEDEHIIDILMRQSHRSGMLLNADELLTLIHLPSPSIGSQKLIRTLKKSKGVPQSGIGNTLVLGKNSHKGAVQKVSVSNEQRLKHAHIIGATGSGKSTLLLNMILQDMEEGNGIAVMDPHGDLIEEIIAHIPDRRLEDVILFDPSDTEYPVGFNVLKAHSEIEKNILESDLVATFRRFSTTWGDLMTSVLGHAIQVFLESSQGGTLADLRKFLLEQSFRESYLKTVGDSDLIYYWEKEFPLLKGNSLSSILVRLDSFLRSKIIRNIVSQKEGVDIGRIMNDQKIFLVKLSQGLIGEENSALLGTLLISKFHQTAISRQALDESERRDFFLYIDEFHQFISPSMISILSGARKYHLGLVLAHQEMRQIISQNPEIAHSLINNAGTRICFRLGDYDAEKLQDGFSYFKSEDLQNLGVGEAICRIEKAENDFNLKTFPISSIEPDIAKRSRDSIREISRKKYDKNVEEKINEIPITPQVIEKEVIITPLVSTRKKEPQLGVTQKSKTKTIQSEEEKISQHRYLQSLIKKLAEDRGYKAVIEAPTSDKLGRVDVSLEKDNEKIAVEISVTTSEEHEFQNVKKCLAAGYKEIIVCTVQEKRLEKLKSYINKRLPEEKIQFLLPDDLIKYLNSQSIKEIKQEQTVKGYRVKVQYNIPEEQENADKRETISRVILNSIKRMKQ